MPLTLPYHPKRYRWGEMEALRRLVVIFFVVLMAFSPVAAEAAACMNSEAANASQVSNANASHEITSSTTEHSIPTNDKNAPHCATCCLAHNFSAPLSDAVAIGVTTSIAIRIGLPRDWAGVPDQAPNALLRPPRP
jgi:hypothetical protein